MKMRNPTTELGLIVRAAAFAADKHRGQRRKDAEASPYINHPLALADILANEGGISDARVIAAALLHDTVEDTETTPQEWRDAFGDEIAATVAEVTDDHSLPKDERKRLQVIKAHSKSDAAKLVRLADKISNLRDIAERPRHSGAGSVGASIFIAPGKLWPGFVGSILHWSRCSITHTKLASAACNLNVTNLTDQR